MHVIFPAALTIELQQQAAEGVQLGFVAAGSEQGEEGTSGAAPAGRGGRKGGKPQFKLMGNKPETGPEQPQGWFELKQNTSVYVTGLPEDVTAEEVAETFGKCGIIKEDDKG